MSFEVHAGHRGWYLRVVVVFSTVGNSHRLLCGGQDNRVRGRRGANAVLDHVRSASTTFHPHGSGDGVRSLCFFRPVRRVAVYVASPSCRCKTLGFSPWCQGHTTFV